MTDKDEPPWQSMSLAGVNLALLVAVLERPARNQPNKSQLQRNPKVSSSHFKMDGAAKNVCWKSYVGLYLTQ